MTWTVAVMIEKKYSAGAWWATLKCVPDSHPTVLGIAHPSEKADYEMLSSKFGKQYQFFLLNKAALEACAAARVNLHILGSVEASELSTLPTILLRR